LWIRLAVDIRGPEGHIKLLAWRSVLDYLLRRSGSGVHGEIALRRSVS
jgi:hypothetical protein